MNILDQLEKIACSGALISIVPATNQLKVKFLPELTRESKAILINEITRIKPDIISLYKQRQNPNENKSPNFLQQAPAKDYKELILDWRKTFDKFFNLPRSQVMPNKKWDNILYQARLLYTNETNLINIIHFGWTIQDIFGCHKTAPNHRYDAMGLLMGLSDGNFNIKAIKEDVIELQSNSGAIQHYRKISSKRSSIPNDWVTLFELDDFDFYDGEAAKVAKPAKVNFNFEPSVAAKVAPLATTSQSLFELPDDLMANYVDFYEERAAIREFDGGMNKSDAEWEAKNETILKFMNDQGTSTDSFKMIMLIALCLSSLNRCINFNVKSK